MVRKDIQLAVTGGAFAYFQNDEKLSHELIKMQSLQNKKETGFKSMFCKQNALKVQEESIQLTLFKSVVQKARVFARFKPEQKSSVVRTL